MKKVFIDGEAGTTGLRIHKRLSDRNDIKLLTIKPELRKNPAERAKLLNEADVAFLCLPDSAAVEAVALVENPDTVIIDASTAHRTSPGWAYGFPELSEEHFEAIRKSKRIAVPGCHAAGFIALVYPLIEVGILPKDSRLACFSLTGYSGGGNKMIAEYETEGRAPELDFPRVYAIEQRHKHLKEMMAISGLEKAPHFSPIVADYYSGMLVTVPLFAEMLGGDGMSDIIKIYKRKYNGEIVRYCDKIDKNGFVSSGALSGVDYMNICVMGNEDRITLCAQFDNLGKGASGSAVECMNIVLGIAPKTGLVL
ncbi:MAG: N-acetyl-gamma-glutamyl-phosphate reductase [Clostridiales bacterium]|nr:N-acetyl-gamma-glutamyl-phosphate reductase [Clostridiales bacterium]